MDRRDFMKTVGAGVAVATFPIPAGGQSEQSGLTMLLVQRGTSLARDVLPQYSFSSFDGRPTHFLTGPWYFTWEDCDMKDLRKGDYFRQFQQDGTRVIGDIAGNRPDHPNYWSENGYDVWRVLEHATYDAEIGVWGVTCDMGLNEAEVGAWSYYGRRSPRWRRS